MGRCSPLLPTSSHLDRVAGGLSPCNPPGGAASTVFLVEHDMRMVMGVSDRVAVLNQGKIIAQGTPEEIQGNSEVIRAYLG